MKLVYVAGPFSAPTREGVEFNIREAVKCGIEVARVGAFPVVPHANTSHPDYEKVQPYEFWIDGTMLLLQQCHALITVRGWMQSSGARKEHAWMIRAKRPVFHDTVELKSWLETQR